MADESKDNDLPLVSNVKDILVKHYMFNFSCNFEERCFKCTMLIYLEPVIDKTEIVECLCSQNDFKEAKKDGLSSVVNLVTTENDTKDIFMLILDCHKILIHDVEEINLTDSEKDNVMYKGYNPALFCATKKLNFCTDKWSLKIWTDSCFCKFCFPTFIRISYQTSPEGSSLLWVTDQDKKPAVFTYGAWINNRSLYPCQEPPSAMATWEATVSVDNSAVVLMSGDEDARITINEGRTHFYYFTKSVLPLSTLCLAIGFWQEHAISLKHRSGPKCRIFSPPSLIDKSVQELFEYAPYCLKISEDVFGPYPFPRIDFLIVPPTFGSLGMASPNVVFLSQSLLTGDYSMCSRVAHEIAHGWFGLLIGASDWTEEWLSEGFATFVEDYFHVYTMNMSENDAKDYIEIKTYIRLRTLLQEISNTNEDLQVLRPNKGETVTEAVDGVNATVVHNGQNPMKAFIQVHYIKGYFLLKHLANIVGIDSFLGFLKGYIEKYRGKLVTSIDFLTEFLSWFASARLELTMERIYEEWLHNADIPSELKCMKPSSGNKMYLEAMTETQKWQQLNSFYLKQKKRRKYDMKNFAAMTSEQLVLILENLLEEPSISVYTLSHLNEHFTFDSANAEVQHRWFELVVKYKYKPGYDKLQNFLTQHLAMGVYLFGEMFFSKDSRLRRMAEESYLAMKSEMEPSFVSTLDEMLQDA